jgi:cell division transport system permease protein
MMKRRSLFNMQLTTTISVALVLFLVGLECVVMMSARELMKNLREKVTLTIVLDDEATQEQMTLFSSLMDKAPYVNKANFISKEEALQEHITNLGEDPSKFLGYNPLVDAFELYLNADYTQADSIAIIETQLLTLPYVDQVKYQVDIVDKLDKNLTEFSVVLLLVAAVLLVIALVLISNTIQLQIYSKRFLINTMRLVGATPWVIKWPFIRRNLFMGLEAALIACAILALTYYYFVNRLGIILFSLTKENIAFLSSMVVVCGLLITFFASLAATNRYIRMKTNKLYEI